MFGFLKKNSSLETSKVVEFDKHAWVAFVDFVHQTKYGNIKPTWPNRLFVDYKYLDVEYNCLLYRYILKDGKFLGVEFFVPENEKSTLSHRLINRTNNTADAIIFVSDLARNKFASWHFLLFML